VITVMLTTFVLAAAILAPPAMQTPQTSERVVLAGSVKVDRIDISTRSIMVRDENNQVFAVYVDPSMKVFDQLKTGDIVRVRVVDSVVVAVVRNAKPTVLEDTTAAARKAGGDSPAEVLQQLKAVVTIESVDLNTQTVVYRTGENRSVTRYAVDPHLLENLKKGDVVQLTYTRQRAVELEKR
jgi:hypothetical protein